MSGEAMRLLLAFVLGLPAAAVGGTGAVLLVAKATGRLERLRYAGERSLVFDIRSVADLRWQLLSSVARACGAFAAARLLFAVAHISPTPSFAITVVLIFVAWDSWKFYLASQSPYSFPAPLKTALWFGVAVRLLASSAVAFLFLRT